MIIGIDCGYRIGGVGFVSDEWSDVEDLPEGHAREDHSLHDAPPHDLAVGRNNRLAVHLLAHAHELLWIGMDRDMDVNTGMVVSQPRAYSKQAAHPNKPKTNGERDIFK